MNVYTARIDSRDPDRLDVTRLSGKDGAFLAPSWAILRPAIAARREAQAWVKAGNEGVGVSIECAAWDVYEPAYLAEMRTSYVRHRARWDALLQRERVVLLCFCPMRIHCHRGLLAERILPALGAIDCGEIAS